MNGPFIRYENFRRSFVHFVTIHAFDRQIDILLMAKTVMHRCSAVNRFQLLRDPRPPTGTGASRLGTTRSQCWVLIRCNAVYPTERNQHSVLK